MSWKYLLMVFRSHYILHKVIFTEVLKYVCILRSRLKLILFGLYYKPNPNNSAHFEFFQEDIWTVSQLDSAVNDFHFVQK